MPTPDRDPAPEVIGSSHNELLKRVEDALHQTTLQGDVDEAWVPHVVAAHILLAETAINNLAEKEFVRHESALFGFLLDRYESPLFVPGDYLSALAHVQARGYLLDNGVMLRLGELLHNDTPNGAAAKGVLRLFAEANWNPTSWLSKLQPERATVAWANYHSEVTDFNKNNGSDQVGNEISREHLKQVFEMLEFNDIAAWQNVAMVLVNSATSTRFAGALVNYVRRKFDDRPDLLKMPQDCAWLLNFALAVSQNPAWAHDNAEWLANLEGIVGAGLDGFKQAPSMRSKLGTIKINYSIANEPGSSASRVVRDARRYFSDSANTDVGHPVQSRVLLEVAVKCLQLGRQQEAAEIIDAIGAHKTWATALLEYSKAGNINRFMPTPNQDNYNQRIILHRIVRLTSDGGSRTSTAFEELRAFVGDIKNLQLLKMTDGHFIAACLERIWAQNSVAGELLFDQLMAQLVGNSVPSATFIRSICNVGINRQVPYVGAVQAYRRYLIDVKASEFNIIQLILPLNLAKAISGAKQKPPTRAV